MGELAGADAPEVDGELAGEGDDGLFARGAGGGSAFGEGVAPFLQRAVVGLEADEAPGGFDQGSADSGVAMSPDGRTRPVASLVMEPWRRVWPVEYSLGQRPV